MGEIVLIIARIIILIVGTMCLIWPTMVIRLIYLFPKSIFTTSRLGGFIDPKTKEALKLIDGDPEIYEDKFPVQIKIMRISGLILIVMFILSLCMVAPST